jgi:HSP20 family protein
MTLLRFDPARSFETIARKMNDLTSEMEKGFSVEFGSYAPRIDITENETKMVVIAEIPGVKKEDVSLTVNDENILIISGTKKTL